MAIGTVVIDGRTYGITGLRLHDGLLKITAVRPGPVPSCRDVPATVFGEDGLGVCQSWNVTISPEEAAMSGCGLSSVTVELPIRIVSIEAVP